MTQWISVKDRMPISGQNVLVCSDGNVCSAQVFGFGDEVHWNPSYFDGGPEGEWDFRFKTEKISHWAELPEAPK
jgi:Protein of unknown function (DUF551)